MIREVSTDVQKTDNKTVFHERFSKSVFRGSRRRETICGKVALRSFRTSRTGRGLLNDRIDNNRTFRSTEVFRTLKTRIGGNNTKVRAENFGISRTTASITFIELLELKSLTKTIDSSGSNRRKIGNKTRITRRDNTNRTSLS